MSLRDDEAAAQEIIGFMLALAAVMVLFAAAAGYGLQVRDSRVDDAAGAAVDEIARRLFEAVHDAAAWSEHHPDAFLNLTVTLPRMPGATGFIAEANEATLFVNSTSGAASSRELPPTLQGKIAGSLSGTPEQAVVRWDPDPDGDPLTDDQRIILELP